MPTLRDRLEYLQTTLGLDEEEIFLGVSDQIAAEGNPGHDASRVAAEGKALCNKLAEGEPNEARRLSSSYSMPSAVTGGVSGF